MTRIALPLALVFACSACVNALDPADESAAPREDPLPVLEEEPPADEPPVDEPPADDPPVDEPPVDEPPVDEPPVDDPPVDVPTVNVGGDLPMVCPDDDGSPTRGVLVIEKGLGGGVRLFQLSDKGRLYDPGVRIDVALPQGLDYRADGREALVTYGTSNADPAGVLVLSIALDGSGMEIAQDLELGPNAAPLEISYTSADSAIVSRIGPGDDDLVPLARGSDGKFLVGASWAVPGEWPQRAVGVPGHDNRALLLRADIPTPSNGSEVIPLSDEGGVITTAGPTVSFGERPFFLYMHPDGDRAYVPTAEPTDDDILNPSGRLEVLSPSGETWSAAPSPFPMPERASLGAVAPQGDSIVFTDGVLDWGPTGVYIEYAWWELYRVLLNSDGAPIGVDTEVATFPASLVYGIAQSRTGHTVVAYDTGPLVTGGADVLVVYTQGESGWAQVCGSVEIDGSADLAVSRAP